MLVDVVHPGAHAHDHQASYNSGSLIDAEISMRAWKAQVVIKPRPQPEGGYSAEVPSLQGSRIVAPTVEQAIRDIYEVIEMSVASRIEHGEQLPSELHEVCPDAEGTIRVDVAIALA